MEVKYTIDINWSDEFKKDSYFNTDILKNTELTNFEGEINSLLT